jgi:hydroxypyruvate isomerase
MALKFSANLSALYKEVPFLDRFARAAEAGFSVVEVEFPYEAGIQNVKSRLDSLGLTLCLFNLPPGDAQLGEWGFLSNPAKRDYFQQGFEMALEAARLLKCQSLNTMYGQRLSGVDLKEQRDCACENLAWAAPQAEQAGVTLLIEPLNPADFPNYALQQTAAALDLLTRVDHASARLLYNVYHAQMTEGNLINTLKNNLASIGHIQVADVPGRHQPGTGEINFEAIFACLEEIGYPGFVGLEYNPAGDTESSLAWLARARRAVPDITTS